MNIGKIVDILAKLIEWEEALEKEYAEFVNKQKLRKLKKVCKKYRKTRDPKHLDAVRKYLHKL